MKYKIAHLINNTYQVIEYDDKTENVVHQGNIADCEAWIKVSVLMERK